MTRFASHRSQIWAASCVLAVLVLGGCSAPSDRPAAPQSPSEPAIDLNAPNGGFTDSAEQAGFGDATLLQSAQMETEVDDPIADQSTVREWLVGVPTRVYVLTARWGMLEAPPPTGGDKDGDEFDWTGHLSIGRGAIVLRSTISFEREDSLLPRSGRTELGWISHTGDGFDGIRVLVVDPMRVPDPRSTDTLRFEAGRFSRAFTFTELDSLDELIQVDDQGNQVQIQSSLQDLTAPNLTGVLSGTWNRRSSEESVGRFQGLWLDQRGRFDGFFRGVYGVRESGDQVFFGKIVDRHGNFRGLMNGVWGEGSADSDPATDRAGWFRGAWLNGSGQKSGNLNGRWWLGAGRLGILHGIWCRGCAP